MTRSRFMQAPRARVALSVALGAVAAAVLGTSASAYRDTRSAHSARVLNVRDEGRLHYIKSSGELVIDEGRATGSFPGWVKARFLYDGEPTARALVTITGSHGSINARGTARLSSLTSASPSFRGTMTITGGSGRYAHAGGRGAFFGVFYRRSYGLTVQAIGKLSY
jgi:hypothetical protein